MERMSAPPNNPGNSISTNGHKNTVPPDNTPVQILDQWVTQYRSTRKPVRVNFSTLTSDYYIKDKATHLLHFYPAKLLRQIPEFFIKALSLPGQIVFDPFSGSGTVPLEALIAGRKPVASEINPLARLITQVKTTPIPEDVLKEQESRLLRQIDLRRHSASKLPRLLFFWHAPAVLRQLSAIANTIKAWTPDCEAPYRDAVKNLFLLALSSIIRKKSLADPRVAPPVRLNPKKFRSNSRRHKHILQMLRAKRAPNSLRIFREAINDAIKRVNALSEIVNGNATPICFVGTDARAILASAPEIDLIVTSPPYIAAQKYTRSTSLELYWLGFFRNGTDRASLEHRVIGSEIPRLQRGQSCPRTGAPVVDRIVKCLWRKNRGRAKIVSNYFADMSLAIQQMNRVLRPGGHLVMVIGNNTVCGQSIPVSDILLDMCQVFGLEIKAVLVDKIRAYGFMTKRNHTAGIITREHILVMQKKASKSGVPNVQA